MIREHNGSTLEEPAARSLTWDEAAARHGHDCAVVWDRDMGAIDWVPVLRERRGISERLDRGAHYEITVRAGSELWADDANCADRMLRHGKLACRCHRWDRAAGRWLPRISDAEMRREVDSEFQRRLNHVELTRSVVYAGVHEFGRPKRSR